MAFLLLFPDRHQEGRSVFQEVYLNHCPLSGLCLLSVCSVAVQRRTVAWTEEPLLSALPTPRTKCLVAESSSHSSLLGCKLCRKWLCHSHSGRG